MWYAKYALSFLEEDILLNVKPDKQLLIQGWDR